MAVIFAFSAQANSGAITQEYFGSLNVPIRKCGHMFEFGLLFLLFNWALYPSKSFWNRALLSFLLTIAYAFSDEWHQSFVPGRTSQLSDVIVDGIGTGATWAVLAVFTNFKGARGQGTD